MTDDLAQLSERLHDAVDHHVVVTPDLLPLARRTRTRRRIGLASTAAVVLVAATVWATQSLPHSAVSPEVAATPSLATPSRTAPTPSPSASAILSHDEIVRRCAGQMLKYESIHTDTYTPFPHPVDGWVVAHEVFSYREGDVVALFERGLGTSEKALCRIPAAEQGYVYVPFTAFDPANLDEARRVMRCSEGLMNLPTSPTPGSTYPYLTPDLRGATVVASEVSDRIGILMLRQGSAEYLCRLFPAESLGGLHDVTPLPVQPAAMKPYLRGNVVVDTTGTYFYAAGWLPSNAASIEFSVKGTVVHSVTPTIDGAWTAVWKVAGSPKIDAVTYTTRSASGAVLATGSLN
jgi:hypothetical protein